MKLETLHPTTRRCNVGAVALCLAGMVLSSCAAGASSTPPASATRATADATREGLPSPSTVTSVVKVPEFGVAMTAPGLLGTVTYMIDTSSAGPKQDADGRTVNGVAAIWIYSSTYGANAAVYTGAEAEGCHPTPPAQPMEAAVIEVFQGNLTAHPPQFASGPSAWTFVGKYTFGFSLPTHQMCESADAYIAQAAALTSMFSTLAA